VWVILKIKNEQYWVVFIQVSLQTYYDHKKKLTDMFHKPPSLKSTPIELKKKRNISLYTYYRRSFCIKYENKVNVILLYVSPMEMGDRGQKETLPMLQESIKSLKHVKQVIHVGILSNASSFFKEYKDKFFS